MQIFQKVLGRADNEMLRETGFCLLICMAAACPAPRGPGKAAAVEDVARPVGRHGCCVARDLRHTHMPTVPSSFPREQSSSRKEDATQAPPGSNMQAPFQTDARTGSPLPFGIKPASVNFLQAAVPQGPLRRSQEGQGCRHAS